MSVNKVWSCHHINCKTTMEVGILAKIRRFISESTAARIYTCMIRPHLDYIDYIDLADRVSKINNIQKKAIRRIEYIYSTRK